MRKQQNNTPARLSVLLLWGGTLISLLLLVALGGYFYVSTVNHNKYQLNSLVKKLEQEQVFHLNSELDDLEYTVNFAFAGAVDTLKQRSQEQTKEAISLLNTLYERHHTELSEEEMKQMLVEALRDIRFFDGRGYFFIADTNGVSMLQPTNPSIEGVAGLAKQDETDKLIIQGHINAVYNDEKAGFHAYRWYPPGNDVQMADKISFVQLFEPYNWVVGTGDYLFSFEDDLKPKIFDYIRHIRFGKSGYIAIASADGTLLANGITPEYEGINYQDYSDPVIKQGAALVMDAVRAGGGLVSFDWYRKADAPPSRKLTLVRLFPGRDWIMMASTFNDELDALLADQREQLERKISSDVKSLIAVLSLFCLFSVLITQAYHRWLSSQFKRYQKDIDHQHQLLKDTADSLELSGRVMQSAMEGILVCDADLRILKINEAFTGITGYQEKEVVGNTPSLFSSGRHDVSFFKQMWKVLLNDGCWRGEIWNKRKNGEVYPELLSISIHKDSQGNILNYIATYNDISKRKAIEEQLRHLAETDSLTGLANRRTLMTRLNHELAVTKRYDTPKIGLAFIDLDYFKSINDNFGHDIGDMVIIEISKRLINSLRASDMASRIGGDEFVVILKLAEGEGPNNLKILCGRLLDQLIKPISLPAMELDVSCSMGVALNKEDNDDALSLMKCADHALYEAKNRGRGRVVFYSEQE